MSGTIGIVDFFDNLNDLGIVSNSATVLPSKPKGLIVLKYMKT